MRRYRGGPLDRFRAGSEETEKEVMGLDEMCVLGFLKVSFLSSLFLTLPSQVDAEDCTATQADNAVLANEKIGKAGSVATIALLHSLDIPHSLPYYTSSLLSLTIAHLGDTRAILASRSSGRATPLTENHHPDSRIESERLRQSGTGIVTDSFGESRWGGTLANTRGVGDREFKTLGVIGEPVVTKRVLKGVLRFLSQSFA